MGSELRSIIGVPESSFRIDYAAIQISELNIVALIGHLHLYREPVSIRNQN
jgi:hypothetical protein